MLRCRVTSGLCKQPHGPCSTPYRTSPAHSSTWRRTRNSCLDGWSRSSVWPRRSQQATACSAESLGQAHLAHRLAATTVHRSDSRWLTKPLPRFHIRLYITPPTLSCAVIRIRPEADACSAPHPPMSCSRPRCICPFGSLDHVSVASQLFGARWYDDTLGGSQYMDIYYHYGPRQRLTGRDSRP